MYNFKIKESGQGIEPDPLGRYWGEMMQALPTPTFSPAAGTYGSTQSVEISCSVSDVTIFYTTDGSTPTINSSTYTGAINVSTDITIKAIAVKNGYGQSGVASAAYIIVEYIDDFTGTDGDPPDVGFWTVISNDVSLGTPYIDSNKLYFYHPAGNSTNPYARSIPKLTGDFDIEIRFFASIDPATEYTGMYFGVSDLWDAGSQNVRIIRRFDWQWSYEFWDGGFNRKTTVRHDSTGRLRIVRTGPYLRSYIWDTGGTGTWVEHYTGASATTTNDLYIYLLASNSVGATSYPAHSFHYDDFVINSGTLVWP